MKRKFLTNLFLLIFLNLLIKPFWIFGIDREVQNLVGSGEYGFYFSLFNFSLLFNILLDLGVSNLNNREISKTPGLFKEYFSNIVVVKLLLAIIYGIVSISVAFLLGYEKRQTGLLAFLIINQFLSYFIHYLRSNISGLRFYTTDSLLSVLDRTIMIILCSVAIWGHIIHTTFKIEHYVYIQTLSYLVSAIIIFIVLWTKSGKISFSFNPQKAFQLFKKTLPFALLGLLMSFSFRVDSIMLERILPNGEIDAGVYAQSYRILDAASNFSVLFATLLLPMFSRMIGTGENVIDLLRTAFTIVAVLAVAFTTTCFAFSKPIIEILYHEGNEYSATIFSILVLSFIPISLSYIFGTLLTANGNLKQLNYIALGGVIINVTLNFILIPRYKAMGAAVATLTTQTLTALVQVAVCMKTWNLKIKIQEFSQFTLFIILSSIAVMLVRYLPVFWLLNFIIGGLFVYVLALLTGILKYKNILGAIRLQLKRMEA